ncbi:APC family permease [Tunicatimonas pelagia]|uniref:APC family permease n=1 Tax=Tunicatimonas pelagia TaxID=931531 RepID=UPI0026652A25|nr:amino acid permease [Tunicatimonas pelagia]WKN41284.1 amino acid permease [Tunicatimonas pelagia]
MKTTTKISWKTATALVIANMIGTGVFTSLGYQLLDVQSTISIILLWLIGGALALFGAFSYAQLGTHFKESGGDYIFLSRVFHPVLGYLTSWVSLIVGFSAPVAIAAIAMTQYLAPFGIQESNALAVGIIVLIGIMHSFSIKQSERFQNATTVLKVIFVLVLIGLGLAYSTNIPTNAIAFQRSWQQELTTPGFAVSLIYVTYAYVGWNAAAYIVEEIQDVRKNLPKVLITGALFVTVIYVLLQLVFLKHASFTQLEGKVEVATIAFSNLFGVSGSRWVSFFIAIQLVATISGYIWIGSRVTHAMAKEHSLWKVMRPLNSLGIPVRTVWAHVFISIALTLTGTFEQILLYTGFVLQLMSTLAVASVLFVKNSSGFRSPGYPYVQYLFIGFSLWILAYTLYDRPTESLIGLGIIAAGLVTYFFSRSEIEDEK